MTGGPIHVGEIIPDIMTSTLNLWVESEARLRAAGDPRADTIARNIAALREYYGLDEQLGERVSA